MIGRKREMTDLSVFLDAAAIRPMFLALLGDAGIGKSTLLDAVGPLAGERGFQVVRLAADGRPAGMLRRLFASHLDPAAGPPHLHRTLHTWLTSRGPIPPAGEPALLTAMLLTLGRLAAAAPVLILIDRFDQADAESRRLLTQLMRHMSTERVSLVLAARGSEPPDGIGPEIARYRVPPLPDHDAARLLGPAPGRVRQDVLHRAAGNPLALALIADPAARPPDEYRHMFDDIPARTRRLLLHAALAAEQEPVSVLTRAAGGPADLRDWQPAERAGLVGIVDGRVRFAHPVVRECLIGATGPREVRRAHRNLAAGSDDPYRRATHRAAATDGPDEQLAAALEEAAGWSNPIATAMALRTAADHSPDTEAAARRYAKAAFAAYRAGEPALAVDLHRSAAALTDDPDILGVAAAAAGLALTHLARPVAAFELARQAVRRRPRDGQVALTLVTVAATAALMSGRAGHLRQLPALLDETGDGARTPLGEGMVPSAANPAARASVLATAGPADDPAGDPAGDPGRYDTAGDAATTGLAEIARMLFTSTTAWLRDDSARVAAELAAVWEIQRRSGSPGMTIARLPLLILSLLDGGRWAEAADLIDEGERLAAVSDAALLDAVLPALRTILYAWRRTGPAPAPPRPAPAGNAFAESLRHRAAGLTALAAGDNEGAYRHLRALFDDAGAPLHPVLGPRSLPELAAVAGLTGHHAPALAIVAGCRRRAGSRPSSRLAMLLDHATALLAEAGRAEEHFRRAVGDPDRGLHWPLEFAEAQFAYGLWLRRQRRVLESRPYLHSALDTFRRLGARAHAERAAVHVRDSGADGPDDAFGALPAQKQRIARLAAEGLTNLQIAERLVVSPRTIASHLYDIYPRLGIGSRHQLRELLAGVSGKGG